MEYQPPMQKCSLQALPAGCPGQFLSTKCLAAPWVTPNRFSGSQKAQAMATIFPSSCPLQESGEWQRRWWLSPTFFSYFLEEKSLSWQIEPLKLKRPLILAMLCTGGHPRDAISPPARQPHCKPAISKAKSGITGVVKELVALPHLEG